MALLFLLAAAAAAQPAPPAAASPPPPAQQQNFDPAAARAAWMRRRPFISPMGEPFRATETASALETWFRQADRNGDGALSVPEVVQDADRFFATLDTDHDGELAPAEVTRYESDIAPEIQVGPRPGEGGGPGGWGGRGRGRHRGGGGDWGGQRGEGGDRPSGAGQPEGLQGAGRFGLLNIPEPVASADADLNRGVSRAEFEKAAGERFLLLDSDHNGKLTLPKLQAIQEANMPQFRRGGGGRWRNRDDGGRDRGGGDEGGSDDQPPR